MSLSGGIRAGRAFVEMYADSSKLNAALDKAKARVTAFAGMMAKAGAVSAAAGGTLLGPLSKLFTDAVKEGAGIESLAKRFNTTAESISTLKGAFAQAGVWRGIRRHSQRPVGEDRVRRRLAR